ncbi:MAG: 6-phosphogluconolactonase, partial [Parabacteroides sp.]|nr:6-phosphogluconolactonase [Parabacteroides sp.]
MKTNLSSQITLTRIPTRYYRPENAFEHSVLTRLEKVPTTIYESMEEGSFAVAKEIAAQIRKKQEAGQKFVLALPGGRSPESVYKELVRMHKEEQLSFRHVIVFVEYEFYPLSSSTSGVVNRLKAELFDQVDILPENIFYPDGRMPKDAILEFCAQYEEKIQQVGGIDCMLLGIGSNSNIMFNSAGTLQSSRTRMVLLEGASRKEAAATFASTDNVPAGIITMGISTMLKARSVILMAWGDEKAAIMKETIEGKISDGTPSTYLQIHQNAKAIVDLSAAYSLTRISHPWLVTSCEWDNKLIRRAIVWLCQKTGKPILKLTNKDYSENGLGELLALYGSAYNVNIKIFNDIQHTITGWPGGKPNADDTDRPERATPYPKRVLIFSPHPDDDVISMGGTFRRLCDQHHDVHVAYQTSGNIAVGDEEVVRYCEYLRDVCSKYSPSDTTIKDKADEIIRYLRYEKVENDAAERPDVLFMKGTIRREEARHACRYTGIKDDSHIHFLDLPFYETGLVKKNPISEADKDIIKNLLEELKPDQIFVAGDLADPHGTHKVCLDAILAAVDEIKDEDWLKACRIWMYRGAWAEWEMD